MEFDLYMSVCDVCVSLRIFYTCLWFYLLFYTILVSQWQQRKKKINQKEETILLCFKNDGKKYRCEKCFESLGIFSIIVVVALSVCIQIFVAS